MKRFIALLLVLVICFSLCSCFGQTLSGTYVSEKTLNGKHYSVEFRRDGSCTYYDYDGLVYDGTYSKAGDGWQLILNAFGAGITTQITKDGKALIIDNERYIKQ